LTHVDAPDARARKLPWALLIWALFIGAVVPSAVIVALEIFLGDKPVAQVLSETTASQFAAGLDPLSFIHLIPFVALDVSVVLLSRLVHDSSRLRWIAAGGFIGILALMVPLHVLVWLPLYTDERMSSTAVLAFLFIPFYSCVTMVIGLLCGEVAFQSRRRPVPPQPLIGAPPGQ
jgi:hypothetical protein